MNFLWSNLGFLIKITTITSFVSEKGLPNKSYLVYIVLDKIDSNINFLNKIKLR